MRTPNPLDAVGAGTPVVEVGAEVDLVVLDCPTFFLLDDSGSRLIYHRYSLSPQLIVITVLIITHVPSQT